MPNTLDSEIRSRIDAFVNDLSNLVKITALESVEDALGGQAAPARRGRPPGRRGPGRPRGSVSRAPSANGRRGKRAKRSSGDVDATAAKVLAHVRANPGQNVGEIRAALGASSKELQLPVQKLIAAKSLRTTGQRRGTRYFAGGRGGATKKASGRRRTAKKAKGSRRGKRGGRRAGARKTKAGRRGRGRGRRTAARKARRGGRARRSKPAVASAEVMAAAGPTPESQ